MLNELIDKRECYEKTIIKNNELIKRFLLLKENYEADLQRLNFLEEGNYYLEQLPIINCPICHKEMTGNDNELNFQSIIKGCKNEAKKITEQRKDLPPQRKPVCLPMHGLAMCESCKAWFNGR